MTKRIFDITCSILLTVILSPILLVIPVIYLLQGETVILFRQSRIGLAQIPFTIFKFRTLSKGRDQTLAERETRLGRLLRKTSIDELPQLWNVLKGDMSLVGPRPLPIEYLPYFTDEQVNRFLVKPGITGWAQVKGRKLTDWEKKLELDLEYIDKQSFLFDLKIIFLTIIAVFTAQPPLGSEQTLIEYSKSRNQTIRIEQEEQTH